MYCGTPPFYVVAILIRSRSPDHIVFSDCLRGLSDADESTGTSHPSSSIYPITDCLVFACWPALIEHFVETRMPHSTSSAHCAQRALSFLSGRRGSTPLQSKYAALTRIHGVHAAHTSRILHAMRGAEGFLRKSWNDAADASYRLAMSPLFGFQLLTSPHPSVRSVAPGIVFGRTRNFLAACDCIHL